MKNELINDLISGNCIKIGNFCLKDGDISKYYFDMKNLISYPKLLSKIGDIIYNKYIKDKCDIICGIPIGGIPISSYISTKYNKPMIIVRDSCKNYGTKKHIEGNYKKQNRCIIIDDVITTGKSIQSVIDLLQDKVNIVGVVVIMNRQQNHNCSISVKSLFNKTDIVKYRLNNLIEKKQSRLCFSADIENPNLIIQILNKIGQDIVICKIHSDIVDYSTLPFCDFKNNLIELSNKYNFLIMEDRKFSDISYIVEKQYKQFKNWVDLVTVHATVTNETIQKLSGAMIIANMSNNNYDHISLAKQLAQNNSNNVAGFITQKRILSDNECFFFNMTPGIRLCIDKEGDQKYRNTADTDIIIVGRGIYNSSDPVESCIQYKKLIF